MISLLAPLMLATLLQSPGPAPEVLSYRFDQVKRSVYRQPGGDQTKERKAATGDTASSGDRVRTGWLGQAVVSVPERNSRFEIFANSQVQLAGGEPGVLVILNQGRLKAIFQKLVGESQQERRVAVPGALLAVRGTRYGLEVDKDGKSTLVVFEGIVEILGKAPHAEPILVKAGEWSTFGPEGTPKVESTRMRGFEEGTWNRGMRPDGTMTTGAMGPGGSMPKGKSSGMGHMHR